MTTTPDATVPQAIVRPAVDADRRFIVETTAKVRQPRGVTWLEWEPYGRAWADMTFVWQDMVGGVSDRPFAWVVEVDGVILGLLLKTHDEQSIECLYVKREFRGLGYGQLLLDAAGFGDDIPCRAPTESWRRWCARRGIRYTVVT